MRWIEWIAVDVAAEQRSPQSHRLSAVHVQVLGPSHRIANFQCSKKFQLGAVRKVEKLA
jgi:hypothetical protein